MGDEMITIERIEDLMASYEIMIGDAAEQLEILRLAKVGLEHEKGEL